jgi:hypothetical protein
MDSIYYHDDGMTVFDRCQLNTKTILIVFLLSLPPEHSQEWLRSELPGIFA